MKITYNTKNINGLLENARLALIDTAEAVKTDLIQSQCHLILVQCKMIALL